MGQIAMTAVPEKELPQQNASGTLYAGDYFAFDEFQLWPASRILTFRALPIQIGARSLELLIALVGRAGQIVSKSELFALVWPNKVLEESNLRVHIAAVRKALGNGRPGNQFIASIPGRGYSFVVEVVYVAAHARNINGQRTHITSFDQIGFPTPASRLFGRDDLVDEISDKLPLKRLVTIIGTGGIGKTAVALAVARRLAEKYRDGVQVIDLAPVANSALFAADFASMLHLPALGEDDPMRIILSHLRLRSQLIVLDNCDYVIDAVSKMAEIILGYAPNIHLLLTSREPLRVAGEWVQRLEALSVPQSITTVNAADAMGFSAVQLFVERLRACDASMESPSDADARVIAEICARLDGLPLAIELAANRVPLLGLRGLADRLDDRFAILTKGRRTAVPRHQTLGAVIDWSYEGLSEVEKAVWRRFSVFCSYFTIRAADAIANDGSIADLRIVDILDNLLLKSLITSDSNGGETRYRLLESLRIYAFSKLLQNQEAWDSKQRHAQYLYQRSIGSTDGSTEVPQAERLLKHCGDVADLRSALEWAFSPCGDPKLGVRLVASSTPIWFKMGLAPEFRRYLEHAIDIAKGMTDLEDGVRIRLNVALDDAIFQCMGTRLTWLASERNAER
jgi:predicted ATPase/DNA-binding winged helix-turn-helix (wHTH) protein